MSNYPSQQSNFHFPSLQPNPHLNLAPAFAINEIYSADPVPIPAPNLPPTLNFEETIMETDGVDVNRYVMLCKEEAENAKRVRRNELRQDQDRRLRIQPRHLTSKEKERMRSRRESAVTRKRNEVYVRNLEQYTRMVPALEREIAELKRKIMHLEKGTGRSGVKELVL